MNLMDMQLNDLTGTWRSIVSEKHHWDLSVMQDGKFLYDEIKNDEREIASSIMGDAGFEMEDLPILILNNLKLKVFILDKEKGYTILQYPDGSKREFKKIN